MSDPTMSSPPGYAVPIHASLWRVMLLGGVPQEFAVLNLCFWFVIMIGFKAYLVAPLGFALCWIPAAVLGKEDAQFFAVLQRHFLHRDFRRG